MIALYAGFISEHCNQHLRVGGMLLANPSHGDAAMASIDPRYRLHGAVLADGDDRLVDTEALDTHLVPKRERDRDLTIELLHDSGRGIAYTTSPFAYLFERIG